MVDIDFKQYKMLKRIAKTNSLTNKSLTKEELNIIDYLAAHNFVEIIIERPKITDFSISVSKSQNAEYQITEKGKAQIFTFKSTFYKAKTSIILSIISTVAAFTSTIVSIIALLKP